MSISGHINSNGIRILLCAVYIVVFTLSAWGQDDKTQKSNKFSRLPGESILKNNEKPLSESHFTWGADIGGSIDLRGNDMSTFDAEAVIGYKNRFIQLAGIGVGVHRAFGNGNNMIPLYAIFRSSFRSAPSLFFLNVKTGYSFNSIGEIGVHSGFNCSVGVGINLAVSPRFKSHIILSYGYFRLDEEQRLWAGMEVGHVDYAQLRFGVTF